MKIGVDIDGVMTNLLARMIEWARTRMGIILTPQDIYDEAAQLAKGLTREKLGQMFVPEFFAEMEPMNYNIITLQLLAAEGHELHVVTARPSGTEDATREFLKRIPYKTLEFSEDKDIIAMSLGLDRFIEDFSSNANAIAKVIERVYLINQPYNLRDTLAPGVFRVDSVNEVRNRLKLEMRNQRENAEIESASGY